LGYYIKNYIAQYLNTEIAKYIALGEVKASDYGIQVLANNNKINRLGSHFGELDETVADIAEKLKSEIMLLNHLKPWYDNVQHVEHKGNKAILVQNAGKVISQYIDDNISPSEKVKVMHKKSQIWALMDDTKRTGKNTPVRVLVAGEQESKLKKGILIYKDNNKG